MESDEMDENVDEKKVESHAKNHSNLGLILDMIIIIVIYDHWMWQLQQLRHGKKRTL